LDLTLRLLADALTGTIEELREEGITSVRAIAAALNAPRIATPQGKQWYSTSVQRLLKRVERLT